MPKKTRRLSVNAYDAEHVYEWLRMYWRDDDQKFGGCHECERTGRRLERLIGYRAVRRVARVVNRTLTQSPVTTAERLARRRHQIDETNAQINALRRRHAQLKRAFAAKKRR